MPSHEETTRILLVDDEADIREVLDIALRDLGYEVLPAANGEEALQLFKSRSPSLVLTDIKMPSMDGIELLKRIKRDNPECEVIMITGHGDMNLAIKSLKHEATDFITKPINIDALEISLRRARDKIVMREKLKAYTRNLETLVREKSELQDNLAALGLMIGSISHGIKGLLTGLDGGVYLVNAGLKKADMARIREGWDIIITMIDRIRKLAQDILMHAKERKLEMKPVDLPKLADEIARIVTPKMEKHGIVFVRDFAADAGIGTLDARYVTTALINVLENAVDACVQDTSKRKKRIAFRLEADAHQAVFTINDNGIGMDLQTREKIFSLFYSSKGHQGTGLGLFIAHKIIGQHDGVIEVTSSKGHGSTFVVTIPRHGSGNT